MLKRFLLFLRSLFTPRRPTPPPRRPTPPPRRPTPVAGQLRIVQAVAAMPARAGLMPRISYQAALRTLDLGELCPHGRYKSRCVDCGAPPLDAAVAPPPAEPAPRCGLPIGETGWLCALAPGHSEPCAS